MKRIKRSLRPVSILVPGLLALASQANWDCTGNPDPMSGGFLGRAYSEATLAYTYAGYSYTTSIDWATASTGRDLEWNFVLFDDIHLGSGMSAYTGTIEINGYYYLAGTSWLRQLIGTNWVEKARGTAMQY